MNLESEILAIVEATKAVDSHAKLGDFQVHVTHDGCFLLNLKTGTVHQVRDDSTFETVRWSM